MVLVISTALALTLYFTQVWPVLNVRGPMRSGTTSPTGLCHDFVRRRYHQSDTCPCKGRSSFSMLCRAGLSKRQSWAYQSRRRGKSLPCQIIQLWVCLKHQLYKSSVVVISIVGSLCVACNAEALATILLVDSRTTPATSHFLSALNRDCSLENDDLLKQT